MCVYLIVVLKSDILVGSKHEVQKYFLLFNSEMIGI